MNPLKRKMFMQQGGMVPQQMMPPPPQQQMMAPPQQMMPPAEMPMAPGPEEVMAEAQRQEGDELVSGILSQVDSAQDYEQLMNAIRGDEVPVEGRRDELAGLVGEPDAEQTPDSVLTLVQPTMAIVDAQGGLDALMQGEADIAMEDESGMPTDMAGGVGSMLMAGQPEEPVQMAEGGMVRKMQEGTADPNPNPNPYLTEMQNLQPLFAEIMGDPEARRKAAFGQAQLGLTADIVSNLFTPTSVRTPFLGRLAPAAGRFAQNLGKISAEELAREEKTKLAQLQMAGAEVTRQRTAEAEAELLRRKSQYDINLANAKAAAELAVELGKPQIIKEGESVYIGGKLAFEKAKGGEYTTTVTQSDEGPFFITTTTNKRTGETKTITHSIPYILSKVSKDQDLIKVSPKREDGEGSVGIETIVESKAPIEEKEFSQVMQGFATQIEQGKTTVKDVLNNPKFKTIASNPKFFETYAGSSLKPLIDQKPELIASLPDNTQLNLGYVSDASKKNAGTRGVSLATGIDPAQNKEYKNTLNNLTKEYKQKIKDNPANKEGLEKELGNKIRAVQANFKEKGFTDYDLSVGFYQNAFGSGGELFDVFTSFGKDMLPELKTKGRKSAKKAIDNIQFAYKDYIKQVLQGIGGTETRLFAGELSETEEQTILQPSKQLFQTAATNVEEVNQSIRQIEFYNKKAEEKLRDNPLNAQQRAALKDFILSGEELSTMLRVVSSSLSGKPLSNFNVINTTGGRGPVPL
jgi:hypothetical protein